MLNPFPQLLDFALLAPFILRVVLGLLFVNLGYLKLRTERKRWVVSFETLRLKPAAFLVTVIGTLQIAGGTMLIVGFLTQIVALIFTVIALAELFVEYRETAILKRNFVFYLLLSAISLSLLFSGAGLFAIDLPL
jgi:uncharacterized membrane protein YphA (DoxX/SURF4 family)